MGILTDSPAFALHVNGDAAKPGGGSWSTASDARLKEVEGHFSRGLEALDGLEPVRYRYKNDNPLQLASDEEHVGLVAQNVAEKIPEAVETDANGYLYVNNDPILWTMLNSIKELKAESDRVDAAGTGRKHLVQAVAAGAGLWGVRRPGSQLVEVVPALVHHLARRQPVGIRRRKLGVHVGGQTGAPEAARAQAVRSDGKKVW